MIYTSDKLFPLLQIQHVLHTISIAAAGGMQDCIPNLYTYAVLCMYVCEYMYAYTFGVYVCMCICLYVCVRM
jgi:hypothetical protein